MKVEQLMTRNVEACAPHDTLLTAARIMLERDCGCVPVVVPEDGGLRVFGMVTDRDVCMAAYTLERPLDEILVASAMSKEVCSCTLHDSLAVALNVLRTKQLRRLPIVDDQSHLVGVLSLADIAREATHDPANQAEPVKAETIGATVGTISRPSQARQIVPAAMAASRSERRRSPNR